MATSQTLDEILAGWPGRSQRVAAETTERYGPPDEVTPERLIWYSRHPWRRVIVNRDGMSHRFPRPHEDLLEQWIAYQVPPERGADLARFDGSVIVDRTRGELGVRCEGEEMNYLALNLAHEVATGQRGIDDARRTYTEKAVGLLMGAEDPYTAGLQFTVEEDTADRDRFTI